MEGEGILKRYVEISRLIWCVKTITEITTYHHHADIYTKSHTRAQSDILQESSPLQLTSGTHRVILKKPYIAGIKKYCPMKHTHYRETVFRIQFQFKRTGLVKISILDRFRCPIRTGTY